MTMRLVPLALLCVHTAASACGTNGQIAACPANSICDSGVHTPAETSPLAFACLSTQLCSDQQVHELPPREDGKQRGRHVSSCVASGGKYSAACSTCKANTYDRLPGGRFTTIGCRYCPNGWYIHSPALRLLPVAPCCAHLSASLRYSTGDGNSQCTACTTTANTSPDTGNKFNSECSQCPKNTYDARPGGTWLKEGCTVCADGKYSNGLGNDACTDCQQSRSSTASDSAVHTRWNAECSVCPQDTYDTTPGGWKR